jgi:hypothetical protein
MRNPFRYFNSSPEIIRLTMTMYIRYLLSLRQVEYLLFGRGIDICHETVRLWWNRFVCCLLQRSGSVAFINGRICTGADVRQRRRRAISGAPSIMKVRCSRSSQVNAVIAGQHSKF